jgi:hypothetical protein
VAEQNKPRCPTFSLINLLNDFLLLKLVDLVGAIGGEPVGVSGMFD